VFLSNLSLGEFLALFSAASAATVALFLLSRTRRKQVVSTLRFWRSAVSPVETKRRRRIEQPWSLILQLLSIAMLLLAISQPKWGSRDSGAQDHVLLLDTSVWMSTRGAAEQERAAALRWLRGLPRQDRVMMVRASALPEAATKFESDRAPVEAAVRVSQPDSGALDLGRAVEFARQALRVRGGRPGEIVYAGAGRIEGDPPASTQDIRWLKVDLPRENLGLTKIALRRPPDDPALWNVFVTVRNYGAAPRSAPVALAFGGAPAGARTVVVAGGSETVVEFALRTRAAGPLEARLLSTDVLPADDRATLEIPEQKVLRVAVYSGNPGPLRPILDSEARVEAHFFPAAAYQPKPDADFMILDGIAPVPPPQIDALLIQPPAQSSPVTVKTIVPEAEITTWRNEQRLGSGLRSRDARVGRSFVFAPAAGDLVVAEAKEGPVLVTRSSGGVKLAVFGFDPFRSPMQFELVAPLLFANLFDWVAPKVFRRTEVVGGTVGVLNVDAPAAGVSGLRVLSDDGKETPFSVEGRTLRLFTATPATLRVVASGSEQVYSLTLPQVATSLWDPPASVPRGLPRAGGGSPLAQELWPWFALLGAAGLLAEWLLFGRKKLAPLAIRRAA
jgi:hypothetical protein